MGDGFLNACRYCLQFFTFENSEKTHKCMQSVGLQIRGKCHLSKLHQIIVTINATFS